MALDQGENNAQVKDCRDAHYVNTSKVSDNVRALALSEIGIIWIFKKQIEDIYQIPLDLYWPLLLVIIAMALDFSQYLYSSSAWFIYFRKKEKQSVGENDDFDAPPAINWPSYGMFYGKVIAIALSYISLIAFLIKQVQWR